MSYGRYFMYQGNLYSVRVKGKRPINAKGIDKNIVGFGKLGKMSYRYKRRGRRSRSKRKRRYDARPYIRNTLRSRVAVKSIEKKTHDIDMDVSDQTSTATVHCLNLIAQGDTIGSREGDEITATSLQMNYRFTAHEGATQATQIRVIVFQDTSMYGVMPLATDLLESENYLSFKDKHQRKKYKILMDRMWNLGTDDGDIDLGASSCGKLFPKISRNGVKIRFGGSTATIANAQKNSLFCLTISNQGTYGPEIYLQGRLRFYG